MIKYLLKATNEYRVETKDDADILHKQLEEEATQNNWTLSGWSETYKNRKSQGEIIEEWFVCKSVVTFNDVKEPNTILKDIQYNMISNDLPWE